jgi:UDP-N-acetylmuramate--alanine ligase
MRPMRESTAAAPLPSLRGSRVWMVGAGGTGMSGLARLLAAAGARVAGEDRDGGETVDRLRTDGIPIAEGPGGAIPADAALVVATAAAGPGHPTLQAARERGVPVRTYAQMLGELHRVRTGISVAGTHGKSTTTCLLTWVLLQAGLDPGFIAGATCGALGGNARPGAERVPAGALAGRPGLLVTESCEFDRSFHNLRPAIALVNNVEAEHLDCYASLEEVIESFRHFASRLPAARDGGFLLIAHEGAHREAVTIGVSAAVETFGTHPDATHRVERLVDGSVRVLRGGSETLCWRPRLMGAHNALNGAAAGVIALRLGAAREDVERALSEFAGLDRRQQFAGLARMPFGDVRVYDDYGHHPTEIRVTLRAIREATAPRRLVCVFQPHQHSRTRLLMDEFAKAFADADLVLLPDIHFVRDAEEERSKVSSEMLAERVRAEGTSALAVGTLAAAAERARASLQAGDVLVTMGAGHVWKVARELVQGGADHAG